MRLKTVLFFLFLFSLSLQAQESDKQFAFRSLTVEEGLSQNSVVNVAQDSIGYMWFATQDGLNKYDGNTFTVYNKHFEDVTRPSYSRLGKIYVDRESNIWIVTNSGHLERYNTVEDKFDAIELKQPVSNVFQDTSNQLYIGTYENGLFYINSKTNDTVQVFRNQDITKTVYDFLEIQNEVLVAATGGVMSITKKGYSKIGFESEAQINISSLAQLNNHTILAGSYGNGLFYKSNSDEVFKPFKGFTNFALPENLNIQDILVDNNGRLWIATYGEGVYLLNYNSKSIQHFTANKEDPFALHYNDVLSLYEDYTGTIWFGTDGSGVSYYDEHLVKFNVLTSKQVPENVSVDVIRSIAVDDNQNIWLGTSGKGLTKANPKSKYFKTFTTENSKLKSNRIMSLLSVNDELWIGHQGQGLQIKNQLGEFVTYPELENQTIWKIYQDLKQNIWLCTRDFGLLKFDKSRGVYERYNKENSVLTSNNIRTIVADNNQNLWIGTEDNGLFKLDLKTLKGQKIKAIPYKIKSLYVLDDKLWIGTNGNGVIGYDTNTSSVETFTTDYGLANNVIYAILPDSNGNLWLSSNKGITRFNPNDKKKQNTENYTKISGLQAFEYNTGAYFKHDNGQLYFGGIEGLNWFDANTITYNQAKPKTVLTKFEIFGKEQLINQNAKFRHNQNTVTFTFSGMHFSEPRKNYYRYQLVNNDPDWTVPEYNNIAHYTNLAPNEYTFKVMSSNYEGVWNKVPTTYTFTILKPWYATHTAYTIYGLLLLLSIYTIYRYFKFRWEVKTKLQLEHAETERLKKIDEFKTKLYTNISHEFRTPLTLISGPIDNQLSKENLDEKDKKELSLVKQNATRLLTLVNQMLDLSLLDSGQLRLKVKEGNLNIIIKQIIAAFEYKAQEDNITITHQISGLNNSWYDLDVVEKITSNLLSNAIKYAPKESVISFNANQIDDTLVMAVTNINKSIGKKDLGKLFQRFYQDDKSTEGIGVGLALVKELVTLSKGSILANSVDTNKIQFTVTLPISKNAFNSTDLISEELKEGTQDVMTNQNKESIDKSVLLVVEDDQDIRAFIASIFSNNYEVIEAKNGKEGIAKGKSTIPDLIISDIMMPEVNGIELCNHLKNDELTSHIPIILLTAKIGEENEIEGFKTGADAYVTKPFSIDKLKLQVEKLIQSRKQLQKRFSQTFLLNSKEIEVSSVEHQFLERLKSVIETHIIEPDFNAEKLSAEMLMSRMQLHRKLKALTNLTTTEFLRSERLKLALPLLEKSDFTISEIAYKVGFNTPSYFIKSFKDVYKCTPSEYQA